MGAIQRSQLMRAEMLSITTGLAVDKANALELRELKRLELITYEIVPGKFSRDPAVYKVSLTKRAEEALSLARR